MYAWSVDSLIGVEIYADLRLPQYGTVLDNPVSDPPGACMWFVLRPLDYAPV